MSDMGSPQVVLGRSADGSRTVMHLVLENNARDLRADFIARAIMALSAGPGLGGGGPLAQEGTTILGDYVIGSMDSVINALMAMDAGRGGAAPASQDALQALRVLSADEIPTDTECAVCQDGFVAGGDSAVVQLECHHCFHRDCLEPWLKLHGICPTCRAAVAAHSRQESP